MRVEVGDLVVYLSADEPEGGMLGTVLRETREDPRDRAEFGRGFIIELHNWGDKACSEKDLMHIYDEYGGMLFPGDVR